MRKLLATLLAGLVACPAAALAADAEPNRTVKAGSAIELRQALLQAGINRGTDVAVTLRDGSVIAGRVDYVGAHSLFVMDSQTGTITQIAERQLSKLEALIPGGKKVAIIALAAALVIAYGLAVAAS